MDDVREGQIASDLIGHPRSQLWQADSTGWVTIPVCFRPDTLTRTFDGYTLTWGSTLMHMLQEAVRDEWERNGRIRFTGFGMCPTPTPAGGPANTIYVQYFHNPNWFSNSEVGPSASGPTIVSLWAGMSWPPPINPGDPCQNDESGVKRGVLHEFGHALGFDHEQERSENWPGDGTHPYCDTFQDGEGVNPADTVYSGAPYDTLSIMSYCAAVRNLSLGDGFGMTAAYHARPREGSSCQDLSDNYGARPGDRGFLPPSISFAGCATTPTSGDLCQVASDRYGIEAYESWGYAPQYVKDWWVHNGCATHPLYTMNLCQRMSDTFGVTDSTDWGTAPPELQSWWQQNGCATNATPLNTCQRAQNLYAIVPVPSRTNFCSVPNSNGPPNVSSWGYAPADAQAWWQSNGCLNNTQNTFGADRCQHASDLYGMTASDPGFAPTEAQQWFAAQHCTTSPRVAASCQRLSELYGTSAYIDWGFAPDNARTWWVNHGCLTHPTSGNACQKASDLYGIYDNAPHAGSTPLTFGIAPPDVRAWWVARGCTTSPR
jgi:hypothetical protein